MTRLYRTCAPRALLEALAGAPGGLTIYELAQAGTPYWKYATEGWERRNRAAVAARNLASAGWAHKAGTVSRGRYRLTVWRITADGRDALGI